MPSIIFLSPTVGLTRHLVAQARGVGRLLSDAASQSAFQHRAASELMSARQVLVGAALLALGVGLAPAWAAESDQPVATVRDFYRRYLAYDHSKTPRQPRPAMALSRGFRAEVEQTAAACRKYGEGPCGWGADGDEYLDTQETDPGLNFSNSQITFRLTAPGRVQVKLNVYPSITDAGDFYRKTITYTMVREGAVDVVDDIAYTDGKSTRRWLAEERRQLLAHPRPAASGISR